MTILSNSVNTTSFSANRQNAVEQLKPTNQKRFCIALFCALFFSLIYAWFLPVKYTILVEPLPEKNSLAQGSQIWLDGVGLGHDLEYFSEREPADVWRLEHDNTADKDALVFEGNSAIVPLEIQVRGLYRVRLLLAHHNWAGKVQIKIDNIPRIFDLYEGNQPHNEVIDALDFCPQIFMEVPGLLIFFFVVWAVFFWSRFLKNILISDEFIISGIVCFSFFILSCVAFYPGGMISDSLQQYNEALSGDFSSWHPMMMAWWWRLLNIILPGPAPFLVQIMFLYWLAMFILGTTLSEKCGYNQYIIFLFGLMPQCIIILGMVTKDASNSVCLILATAIIFHESQKKKFSLLAKIVLIALFAFCFGCKPNYLVPIFVLIIWWSLIDTSSRTVLERVTLICALILLTVFPAFLLNKIYKPKPGDNRDILFLHDIVGIGLDVQDLKLPAYIKEKEKSGITEEEFKKFVPGEFSHIFFNSKQMLFTGNKKNLEDLTSLWLKQIADHPLSYLKLRAKVFAEMLKVDPKKPISAFAPYIIYPEGFVQWGLSVNNDRRNLLYNIYFWLLNHHQWLFRPWLYAFISICAIFACRVLPVCVKQLTMILSFAMLAQLLPHFFITPAIMFHYLAFSVICSTLQVALFVDNALLHMNVSIEKKRVKHEQEINKTFRRP